MRDYFTFQWDQRKNNENIRKRHISFKEALTVFYDTDARVIFDMDHSADEDRFIILGFSNLIRLLVVCHCYPNNTIRIISARKATRHEMQQYSQGREGGKQ